MSQYKFDQDWKVRMHAKATAGQVQLEDMLSDLLREEQIIVHCIMLADILGKYTQGMTEQQCVMVLGETSLKIQECYLAFHEAYKQGKSAT